MLERSVRHFHLAFKTEKRMKIPNVTAQVAAATSLTQKQGNVAR
jgi:hypothetical protein